MTIDHRRRDAEQVEPNPANIEVLIKEARRHQRRRYFAAALAIAVIGAAAALGAVLDRGGSAPRSHASHTSEVAALATAKTTCLTEAKSMVGDAHGTPHLYGAYPTTDRLAANWPVKIYPSFPFSQLTTTTLGGEQTANSNGSGWPSFYRPANAPTSVSSPASFRYVFPAWAASPTSTTPALSSSL